MFNKYLCTKKKQIDQKIVANLRAEGYKVIAGLEQRKNERSRFEIEWARYKFGFI